MGESLDQLLDDRLNSLREEQKSFKWNPLHVAASKGEYELVRYLLDRHPNLSDTLDSHLRSPLHLASANGHVQIVKDLIEASSKMCLTCDRDGLNPLHAAAMTSRVEVLDELLKANPCAARARVDKAERGTILHLCVKYDRLNFLDELLEKCSKGEEFVNVRDYAGNTILHIAIANKKIEITKHVLETDIDINATNASKQTAMDILHLGRKKGTELEGPDREIEDLLQKKDGKREKDLTHLEWIEKKRKSLTIVSILMATIAFQARVNPPGGVWLDDSATHKAGEAVMAYNHPRSYPYFIRCNTIGFVASLITINFLISGIPFKKRSYLAMLVVVMCVSITSMAFTYAYSIVVFTLKLKKKSVDHTIVVAVVVWSAMLAILLLVHGSCLIANVWNENKDSKAAEIMIEKFVCFISRRRRNLGAASVAVV